MVHEIENFLPPAICQKIVHWFSKADFKCTGQASAQFQDRTSPYKDIDNIEIKQLVNMFRFDATCEARRLYNVLLWPSYTDLVYWPDGSRMEVHADACYLDGSPNYCPERKVSAVLYLNDDYEGGETFFPDFDLEVKPATGKIAFFLSGLSHKHGVRPIKGKRYTMPIWFTITPSAVEL